MTTATTANTKDVKDQFKDILGPTDPKVDAEARERLITARIGLLLKQPFFGNLATRMQLTNTDTWCPTAATDGRKFYYNSRFIMMLKGEKEVEFLFGHEVLHAVYEHIGRRVDNDHQAQLSNIAADYCVNGDLVQHKIGEMITTVPCLHETKYYGWNYERVYEDLYDNAEKIDVSELVEQLLDEHLENEESTTSDGPEGKDGDGDEKDGKGKPKLSKEELQEIKDELKEAVVNASKQTGAGNLPNNVKRIIQEITDPKMNWRELLRQQLESTQKSDYTWQRPSRRAWHMDAILPGTDHEEMIDIVVALDMSGSISDSQARDFLSELKGITEEFNNYKIHIFSFDTEVYNPKDFTSENLDDILDYEPEGGGGTDFACMFNYMKDNDINPARFVVFTDGYPFGTWGDPNYCDTVWIIHGDDNPNPPFGTWALYEEDKS
jgi:predicted metal-dependent peptidase